MRQGSSFEAATSRPAERWRGRFAWEHGLAALLLLSLVQVLWRYVADGYLPQPFYYKVDASLMDFYETAYWSHRAGAYSVWRSIYPPLSFDFLRLITPGECYRDGSLAGRACDGVARWLLPLVFAVNAALVYLSYRRADPGTAAPRALAVAAGLPMLYALERGNLLIPCFTLVVLGMGPLLQSAPWRWLALGLAANFKPYLLMPSVAQLARRDWRWLVGFGLSGLAIYLVTWRLNGVGSPIELLTATGGYAGGKMEDMWANLYFATSYWPALRLATVGQGAAPVLAGSAALLVRLGFLTVIRLVQLGAAVCLAAAFLWPRGVNPMRLTALFTAMTLTTVTNGSSGYTLIFLMFLIFFEPWRGPARIVMLTCAYLVSLPIDLVIWPVHLPVAHSFLGGVDVAPRFGLAAGQLARPALLLVINAALIVVNLQDSLSARALARSERTATATPN